MRHGAGQVRAMDVFPVVSRLKIMGVLKEQRGFFPANTGVNFQKSVDRLLL